MTLRLGPLAFSTSAEFALWFAAAASTGAGLPNPQIGAAEFVASAWPQDEAAADAIVEGLLLTLDKNGAAVRAEALRALQTADTPAYRSRIPSLLGASWVDDAEPAGPPLGYGLTLSLLHGPGATDDATARALWAQRDRFGTRDLLLQTFCTAPIVKTVGVEVLRAEARAGRLDPAQIAPFGATLALYGGPAIAVEVGTMLRGATAQDRAEFLRLATPWVGDRVADLKAALGI